MLVKPLLGAPLLTHHPLAYGLVGCWLFNEGAGLIAADSSGQGNHGTLSHTHLTNMPTWVAGPNGGALAFSLNPYGGYVKIPDSQSLSVLSDFTLLARILPTNWLSNYGIVEKVDVSNINGYAMRMQNTTGKILGLVYDGVGSAGVLGLAALSTTIYSSVGVSFRDSTDKMQLWRNGAPDGAEGACTKAPTDGSNFLCIGTRGNDQYDSFVGLISDVMIWNRALSAEEISYLYHHPYAMFDPAGMETGPGIPIYGTGV